jgi:hypothetical protein
MYEFDILNYFGFYNSLDIDWDIIPDINLPCSTHKIIVIVKKIRRCPNLMGIRIEDSNKKGYHLRFYCKVECDKCRMVFDDDIRFNADNGRKKEFTNIIFDTKKGY